MQEGGRKKEKEEKGIAKHYEVQCVGVGLVMSLSFLAEWDLCLYRSV